MIFFAVCESLAWAEALNYNNSGTGANYYSSVDWSDLKQVSDKCEDEILHDHS